VLRWFEDLPCQFYGTDISQEAIDWCKVNIPFAKFAVNTPFPPLPFPDASFDLIYGISVLTHLDEQFQFAWLKELHRLAKPGAIVILTVHGDHAAMLLPDEEYTRLRKDGFLFRRVVDNGGVDGLPDFYQVSYHLRSYIERNWSRFFSIRIYLRHGPAYTQDLVLMEKSQGGPCLCLDLPICVLEVPKLGALIAEDELRVGGWAFDPEDGSVNLGFWVDDTRLGSCSTGIPRADVAAVFPNFASAGSSGFRTTLSTGNLDEGLHVLRVMAGEHRMPALTTCFSMTRSSVTGKDS
jgi:SAM-dependent methyltransferase